MSNELRDRKISSDVTLPHCQSVHLQSTKVTANLDCLFRGAQPNGLKDDCGDCDILHAFMRLCPLTWVTDDHVMRCMH